MRETLLRMSRREKGASIQQFREGMGLMARWLVAGLFGLLVAGLLPGVASAGGCPNEQFRTGLGAGLPDCRAYEMVSPVDKNGGSIEVGKVWRSSLDGNRMGYVSLQAFADSQGGATVYDYYVALRGADGWSTHALLPRLQATGTGAEPLFYAFSSDLSSYAMALGGNIAPPDDPPLVSGEPRGTANMFVRATDSGASQLVNVAPVGVTPPLQGAAFQLATPDLSHICFSERAKLTANAPANPEAGNFYEWSGGVVSLISVLPGGEPVEHGNPSCLFMSEDGSRTVLQLENNLYLREGGVSKVQIDASQGPGPGGNGTFWAASSDGSRIFFTDLASNGLTNDTPTGGTPATNVNLYEYDVAGGKLTDLTVNNEADVQGVFGASSDGSYLYFVTNGVLADGATAGKANLYVWHEGVTSFIATLESAADLRDWLAPSSGSGGSGGGNAIYATSRVTPDGTRVAFESVASLTGYDNRDANTGQRDNEVFLYDALTGRLVCASCNPSGARPIGSSVIGREEAEHESVTAPPRWLSDDGIRLFFESFDALVPQDVNGQGDVYEYENGSVRLISSGTSGAVSGFAEASASGNDVFFRTTQQLVGQDIDQSYDMYDARVEGGFPAPASPVMCAGEACRGAPSGAPVLSVPGSAVFSGLGNVMAPAVALVVSAPKAKKPKPKVKRRRRHKKKVKGKGRARGARGVRSTGKRG
jgi:hypothetical protein